MFSLVSACRRWWTLICLGAAFPVAAFSHVTFSNQGGEYAVLGALPGDQVFPQLALNPYGGYLVWQDNATDGDGYGISAQRINRSLSGVYGTFRVNQNGSGDQMLPQVSLLTGGGAVFVWQTSSGAGAKVFARFLNADGTFASGDVEVSNYPTDQQITPVVAGTADGNALIVWASSGQDGNMLGVFGQRFSATGAKLGAAFQVNQSTYYNQRTPAVAALPNGNVIVVWVSETPSGVTQNVDPNGRINPGAGVPLFKVDVFGRLYDPAGNAASDEFKVNSSATLCAAPSVSAAADSFLVAWTGKPSQITVTTQLSDGWDIFARTFALDGQPKQPDFKVNTYTYGDQFTPKASYLGGLQFVLWTSLAQDGDREGVVARMVSGNGDPVSREFRVNTTTIGSQMYPAVAASGGQEFLCVWSSFVGGSARIDLFAQRYSVSAQALSAPSAPHVSALSQSRLSVTWPELAGYSDVQYLLYVDNGTSPQSVSGNQWTAAGFLPSSAHTFRLSFKLADGQQSALSDPVTGTTWGEDANFDGLPDDWQAKFFGSDPAKWPGANVDSDGDGATNLQEFLAGTNPSDPASVLRTALTASSQGWRLGWNSEPGCVYQVQLAGEGLDWSNLGSPRFAAGATDSLPITGDTNVALYRVIRVR